VPRVAAPLRLGSAPDVKPRLRGHSADMSTAHVRLSIDMGSEPICGSVATGGHAPQPFCGWVELAAAIEAARVAQPLEPSPRAEPLKT
jgi:hypothetical protein